MYLLRFSPLADGMDLSNPSPMVNGDQMRRFVGRRIRTVLRVVRVESGLVAAQTCDGMSITVRALGRDPWDSCQFVEVYGVLENENTIREEVATAFGTNFGMSQGSLLLCSLQMTFVKRCLLCRYCEFWDPRETSDAYWSIPSSPCRVSVPHADMDSLNKLCTLIHGECHALFVPS